MTRITGSIETKNARQGVEINDYQQVFASTLPRLFPNSSPRIVKNGVNENDIAYHDSILFSEDKHSIVPNFFVENRDIGGTGIQSKEDVSFSDITENDALSTIQVSKNGKISVTENISPNEINKEQVRIRQVLPINEKIESSKTSPFFESNESGSIQFVDIPFFEIDKNQRLKNELNDLDFVETLSKTSTPYQYYEIDSKSSTSGFVSRENFNGTDSISFLDRKSFENAFAPRKSIQRKVDIVSKENIDLVRLDRKIQNSPFNDNLTIVGNQEFYPGNYSIYQSGTLPKAADISVTADPLLSQRNIKTLAEDITSQDYSENLTKEDLLLADETYAKSVIKISIPTLSQSSEATASPSDISTGSNLCYAGRCHSSLVQTANVSLGYGVFVASLFLSSALRDTNEFSNILGTGNKATGIAGTGFLYYSPTMKTWIEKRADFSTSLFENSRSKEASRAFNQLEVNTNIYDGGPGSNFIYPENVERDIAKEETPTPGSTNTSRWWSTKLQVTGSKDILAQFSSSPQIGYFLPYKEHLERIGYQNIGTPTVSYGAPFASKYHAFDHETIKLSDYIDRPFRLRKVLLKVPIELQRRHDFINSVDLPSHLSGFQWANSISSRKDIDNYVFFLYRQRRLGDNIAPTDSELDRQTSTRFLIASASVCVFNSSSFGMAYNDGFMDLFGSGTPIISGSIERGFNNSVDPATYLDGLVTFMTGNNQDPFFVKNLTYVSGPLHNPAIAINAGLTDTTQTERYFGKGKVCISMYPAIVEGGYHVPSLVHITSSTGYLSTSFYSFEPGGGNNINNANRLFNRFPYSGSYQSPGDSSFTPPITTVLQNFWFGGTRQPSFETNDVSYLNGAPIDGGPEISPFVSFTPNDPFFLTQESLQFNESYTKSFFDIEIGRTGLSIFDALSEPFKTPFSLVTDSRSVPNTLTSDPTPRPAGIFRRSNLINFESISSETFSTKNAVFTVGNLSGSSMSDIVSSFTVGYCPPTNGGLKQEIRDYILLPEDELVLGLDAGVTPPPDVMPMVGMPLPDLQGDYLGVLAGTRATSDNVVLQSIVQKTQGQSLQNSGTETKRRYNQVPEPLRNNQTTLGGSPLVIEASKIRKNNSPKQTIRYDAPSSSREVLTTEFNNGSGGGVPCSVYLEEDYLEKDGFNFNVVGYHGDDRSYSIRDFLAKIEPITPVPPPRNRKAQQPFINGVLKERIGHYSGNSYLRILHGEAEIILVGEYVVDDAGKNINRNSLSTDISQTIGNDFAFDEYDIEEDESYRGTYLADFVTGSIFDGTRGVAFDLAIRSSESVNKNFSRFVKVVSENEVIHDLYFAGLNESPASAFRNDPVPSGFVSNPLQNVLGGVSVSSGSFFRGQPAFIRKPAIGVSARLNPRHHGFFSDIFEQTENTKIFNIKDSSSKNELSSPVTVGFRFENQVINPSIASRTTCQNISPTSAVDTPYVDGEAVSREPLETELITLE